MTETEISEQISRVLQDTEVSADSVAALAGQLVWRIGRLGDDSPVTVRVGLTNSAHLFGELPRLRSASDAEVEEALLEGELRVEWVGPRL